MNVTARETELSRSSELLATLLGQIARNQEGSMAELYDRTRHAVYGLVLRILREQSAAEDTMQEIYIQIWRRAEAFDPTRGSALSWIFTISRSRALDKLRSSRTYFNRDNCTVEFDSLLSPDPDPEHNSSASERAQLVRRSLAQLTPNQRRVIEMAFLDGLSQNEIAGQTALPLGTVKTRIRIGMRHLRDDLSVLNRREAGRVFSTSA
jgi:RNA polymerase sigma-70 factor, ECF subfamily